MMTTGQRRLSRQERTEALFRRIDDAFQQMLADLDTSHAQPPDLRPSGAARARVRWHA